MKKYAFDLSCNRNKFDCIWSAHISEKDKEISMYNAESWVHALASDPNCDEFLYYIRYEFDEGIIFKTRYKTVYPNGCTDIDSYKKYLQKKFSVYDFEFLPSDKKQYLLLKFSNMTTAKKKILQNAENNYLAFYNKNHSIIDKIIEEIGFNNIFKTVGLNISNSLGYYCSSQNSFQNSYNLYITTSDINGCNYSRFGMSELSNLDDICKLGVSIAKFIENNYYYISESYLEPRKYNDGTPIKFKFKCDYRVDIAYYQCAIRLTPVAQKQERELNSWN